MVRMEKDLSNFFTDGTSSGFPGDQTGDSLWGQVSFQALDLSGLSTPFHSLERDKERQVSFPLVRIEQLFKIQLKPTPLFSEGNTPSEFVRFFAVMDPCHLVIEFLCEGSDLIVVYNDFLPLMVNLTNRGDDGCCSAAKDLF
jgi:hypothetical protein